MVGAAAGLVMAGSWTGSGNEVGGPQPLPEDEATPLCRRPTRRAASLVRGTFESAHRGATRTRLRVAREGHGGYGLDLATTAIQTRTVTLLSCSPGAGR